MLQWDGDPENINQKRLCIHFKKNSFYVKCSISGIYLSQQSNTIPGSALMQLPNAKYVLKFKSPQLKLPPLRGENEWENETIFVINEEAPHFTYIPYTNK